MGGEIIVTDQDQDYQDLFDKFEAEERSLETADWQQIKMKPHQSFSTYWCLIFEY